ncbi:MAG: hypothetical protein ACREBW_07545 [Candidatus Micrarchaeaceae archaeon]
MKNRSMTAIQSLAATFVVLGGLSFLYTGHAQGVAMEKGSFVDICFIQFVAETYVPLTKENIRHQSFCYKVSSRSDAAIALVGLLNDAKPVSGGSEKFNNYFVRMMLSEPSSPEAYFVDQKGIVSRGKSTTKLSAWQKAAVQIILNSSYEESKSKVGGD